MKTKTIEEGGKHAVFNEDFILSNIGDVIASQELLVFNSYDEDGPGMIESIGNSRGRKYEGFV
tara:strand:- start:463 stop:651 length:189 start_codon:yes stop_codon:yes gene_type:complete